MAGPRSRSAAVAAALAAVVVVLLLVGLLLGGAAIAVTDALAALTGSADRATTYLVMSIRLPHVVVALLAGVAFGVAGMLCQSVARNPLASPDFIGFTAGAAAGAVLQILVFDGGAIATAAGAAAGGLAAGLAVYVLAYRGGVRGDALVLVGIAISAMLLAVTAFLLARADRSDARVAAEWLTGTLEGRTSAQALTLAVTVALLLALTVPVMRSLRLLELGDDSAAALGVGVQRVRAAALLLGVLLATAAVAAAGPIPFVALAAPQIAARLTGGSPTVLPLAALTGGVLLMASDAGTQLLFSGAELPVGVTTGAVGGAYLAWLLWQGKAGAGAAARP